MADISIGLGHINNYVIVSGITIEYGGNDFPILLYLERPPNRGQNPEKSHLLASNRVSATVSAMIHPRNLNQKRTYLAGFKTLGASRSCIKSGIMEPGGGKCPLRFWQE